MTYRRSDGFEYERRDCSVRALSIAANIEYSIVHAAYKKCGRMDCHKTKTKLLPYVCTELNLDKKLVKRSGSVRAFVKKFNKGTYLCRKMGHMFPVINGVAHDLAKIGSHLKGAWEITKREGVNYNVQQNK